MADMANWDNKAVETLRFLWLKYTAAQIARALGPAFTRNAVIGKAYRLGLPRKFKTEFQRQAALQRRGARFRG